MTLAACGPVTDGKEVIVLPEEKDTSVVAELLAGTTNLYIKMNSPTNDVDIHLCKTTNAYTLEDTKNDQSHVGCKQSQCAVGFSCTHAEAGSGYDVAGASMAFSGDNVGTNHGNSGVFDPEWINVTGTLEYNMVLDVHSYTGVGTATVEFSYDGITPCPDRHTNKASPLCQNCADYPLYVHQGCPSGTTPRCDGTHNVVCV